MGKMPKIDLKKYFNNINSVEIELELLSPTENDINSVLVDIITKNIHAYLLPIDFEFTIDDEQLTAEIASIYFDYTRQRSEMYFDVYVSEMIDKSSKNEFKSLKSAYDYYHDAEADTVNYFVDQIINEDEFENFIDDLTVLGVDTENFSFERIQKLLRDFSYENLKSIDIADWTNRSDQIEVLYSPFFDVDLSFNIDLDSRDFEKEISKLIKLMEFLSITPADLIDQDLTDQTILTIDVLNVLLDRTFSTYHSKPSVTPSEFIEIVNSWRDYETPVFFFYASLTEILNCKNNHRLGFQRFTVATYDGSGGSANLFRHVESPLLLDGSTKHIKLPTIDFRYCMDDICGLYKRDYRTSILPKISVSENDKQLLLSSKKLDSIPTDVFGKFANAGYIKSSIKYKHGKSEIFSELVKSVDLNIQPQKISNEPPTLSL
jgi:hypothetical protein